MFFRLNGKDEKIVKGFCFTMAFFPKNWHCTVLGFVFLNLCFNFGGAFSDCVCLHTNVRKKEFPVPRIGKHNLGFLKRSVLVVMVVVLFLCTLFNMIHLFVIKNLKSHFRHSARIFHKSLYLCQWTHVLF